MYIRLNSKNTTHFFFVSSSLLFFPQQEACRCAQFSADGNLVATGSDDYSIKLLDAHKMVKKKKKERKKERKGLTQQRENKDAKRKLSKKKREFGGRLPCLISIF